jgi:hypothetical protein
MRITNKAKQVARKVVAGVKRVIGESHDWMRQDKFDRLAHHVHRVRVIERPWSLFKIEMFGGKSDDYAAEEVREWARKNDVSTVFFSGRSPDFKQDVTLIRFTSRR